MRELKLSKKDLKFIGEKGISRETIQAQIRKFKSGFPPVTLTRAATTGNGIDCLTEEDVIHYAELYERALQQAIRVIKFIPASGAASRMVRDLFQFLSEPESEGFDPGEHPSVDEFIGGLDKLALYSGLQSVLRKQGKDLESLRSSNQYREIVEAVLLEWGLNYGQLPKGLICFHRYEENNRTPVEEHLVEGAAYCRGPDNRVRIHFTVSDEHLDGFINLLDKKQSFYEEALQTSFQVDFSIQRSFTDTIAVDMHNNPLREADGKLQFRPGGHGALLTNLNELDEDLVFIKNIDNVAPDRIKPTTCLFKKVLAGVLVECQDKAFELLRQLDSGNVTESLLAETEDFLYKKLNDRPPKNHDVKWNMEQKSAYARNKLNRPIRVCGMVKNEGEPGGGPFWTRQGDGSVSLQIVESSQIDFDLPGQKGIFNSATHFNPVDLVCGIRNYQGEPFDLQKFVDPETGFISIKSQDGKSLKAQELPGLWNGAMADWNTVFVEVPIETFNPVKTINDLLRGQHIT